jgi:outer membrane protein OmpA-like peptidoglycan-associated protein
VGWILGAAMSGEPTLQKSDSGEWVEHLQELMREAGLWQGYANGTFDDDLEQAVLTMQDSLGLSHTGVVDDDTWSALQQQAESTQQPAQSDGSADAGWADAQGQGSQQLDTPTGSATDAGTGDQVPYLSDDGQWQWDGAQWQPVGSTGDSTTQPTQQTTDAAQAQVSDDGQWQWDGAQWQPTMANPQSGGLQLPTAGLSQHADSKISSESTDSALTGFATGSAVLTAEHQTILAGIAADLNANPLTFGGYVTLTGYADRRGDPAANQELGQRRADAVRAHLLQLLTDDETKQQVRAYSLGAPADGPPGDVPALRKVEIEITRRTYNLDLGPGLTLPGSSTPTQPTPDSHPPIDLRLPPGYGLPPQNPDQINLPDWFWKELPKHPADPPFVTQLSHWLNETLHTHDLARIGGQIAGHFNMDSGKVTRMLDDAFQKAGEAGVKAILKDVIQRVAGPPVQAPNNPADQR